MFDFFVNELQIWYGNFIHNENIKKVKNSEIQDLLRISSLDSFISNSIICFLLIFISCLARMRQIGLCLYVFTDSPKPAAQIDCWSLGNKLLDWGQRCWVFRAQNETQFLSQHFEAWRGRWGWRKNWIWVYLYFWKEAIFEVFNHCHLA